MTFFFDNNHTLASEEDLSYLLLWLGGLSVTIINTENIILGISNVIRVLKIWTSD